MSSLAGYLIKPLPLQSTTSQIMVPSDMKWASTFSGELANSAFYFSPFGNVNADNKGTGQMTTVPGNRGCMKVG